MRIVLAGLVLLCLVSQAHAQRVPVGDPLDDYARVLQLAGKLEGGSRTARPLAHEMPTGMHPWQDHIIQPESLSIGPVTYGTYDPVWNTYVNTERPWGQNDGPVWQGKGVTASVRSGVFASYRFVSASFSPLFVYTANADFPLSAVPTNQRLPEYAYPYRSNIDRPQRFGSDPFADVHAGSSYLQGEYLGLAAGISTENLWWGPGIRNSIMMSNNAPGFRHVYIHTERPVNIKIGTIEGSWIWGSLAHSNYFVDGSYSDDRELRPAEENRRFMTGMVLTYGPKWIDGLYLGAAQSYMVHAAVERYFADYLAVVNLPFVSDTERHRAGTDDKMVSLFARWIFPKSGFEAYGEWARGDHTSTFRDLFVAPDHARGFTLGFQKVYRVAPRYYTRIAAEHTFLEQPQAVGSRESGSYFYSHEGIKQGYTHRGEVLGAGIGPGSQGQFMRVDLFAPFGRVGAHALREVFDNDLYYTIRETSFEHQVDIAAGISGLVFVEGFELEAGITRIKTFNRDFEFRNDTYNTNLRLSIRYRLGHS